MIKCEIGRCSIIWQKFWSCNSNCLKFYSSESNDTHERNYWVCGYLRLTWFIWSHISLVRRSVIFYCIRNENVCAAMGVSVLQKIKLLFKALSSVLTYLISSTNKPDIFSIISYEVFSLKIIWQKNYRPCLTVSDKSSAQDSN